MELQELEAMCDVGETIRCSGILADGTQCTRTRPYTEGEGDRCALHQFDSDEDSDDDDDEGGLLGGSKISDEDPIERVHRERGRTTCCSCVCLMIGILVLVMGVEHHKIGLFVTGVVLVCCPCTALCFVGLEWFCEFYGIGCMERLFIIFSTIQHHQNEGELVNFEAA
jgi:hypothetical protein